VQLYSSSETKRQSGKREWQCPEQKKGMLNLLYCHEASTKEEGAELRKIVGRVKKETEQPEFEPLHQKLEQDKPLASADREHIQVILCRIPELKKNASLELVRTATLGVMLFIKDGSFRSQYADGSRAPRKHQVYR
jgi:hypothetical protein